MASTCCCLRSGPRGWAQRTRLASRHQPLQLCSRACVTLASGSPEVSPCVAAGACLDALAGGSAWAGWLLSPLPAACTASGTPTPAGVSSVARRFSDLLLWRVGVGGCLSAWLYLHLGWGAERASCSVPAGVWNPPLSCSPAPGHGPGQIPSFLCASVTNLVSLLATALARVLRDFRRDTEPGLLPPHPPAPRLSSKARRCNMVPREERVLRAGPPAFAS